MHIIDNTFHVESILPRGGRDYLDRELPCYIRCPSMHQRHEVTCTVARGKELAPQGEWFLVPHATVIAAVKIEDLTPVVYLNVGGRIVIDGATYELRDDRMLQNPYLTLAD